MPTTLETHVPLKIKNTFLHFEKGCQDIDDETIHMMRQESAPARPFSRQLSSTPWAHDLPVRRVSFAEDAEENSAESESDQGQPSPNTSIEPEAEPGGLPDGDEFCRQLSNLSLGSFGLFSQEDMIRQLSEISAASFDRQTSNHDRQIAAALEGFVRQETDQSWPTWNGPSGHNPAMTIGQPVQPFPTDEQKQDYTDAYAPESAMQWPFLGYPSGGATGDLEDGPLPQYVGTGKLRARRKGKSLITLAQNEKLRQQQQRQQQAPSRHREQAPQQIAQPLRAEPRSKPSSGRKSRFCPFCGGEVESQFKFCPYCRASLSSIFGFSEA